LEFDGTDLPFGLETLPIERAYGCAVREAPDISLYFARIGRTWGEELESFLEGLEAWAK